ncbi:MAG: IS66 family insertion sequence element accessory protein TnpB [Deltaproteobacteria bacterium]|jgi:transposase|nr:IS66 family insertion sequence element accessory protein TnpB [Deltaproteobacteria bacterium]
MIPAGCDHVYLALGSTDMRKSINGLSIMVEQAMDLNPFSGDLFVFCNRRRNIIKILYWDRNGFCLWHKRLEEHRFKWPESEQEIMTIDQSSLQWLLYGLDIADAHKKLYYQIVS